MQTATGYLWLYPGRSGRFGTKVSLGNGWSAVRDLVGLGDFNRDGYTDLIAIEKSTGYVYLYRGTGTGFTARVRVGTGWGGMQPLL